MDFGFTCEAGFDLQAVIAFRGVFMSTQEGILEVFSSFGVKWFDCVYVRFGEGKGSVFVYFASCIEGSQDTDVIQVLLGCEQYGVLGFEFDIEDIGIPMLI